MRLVVGITGATGAIFGIRLLERLAQIDVETHLCVSSWGRRTIEHETGLSLAAVHELATHVHPPGDMAATISSGSYQTDGMVIAPCSMRTLGAIATGTGDTLIARAADVTLKERRRLVLLARETPLHEVHLTNMLTLTRMGATVLPPVPAFYHLPVTLEDILDHIVGRTLDQLGLDPGQTPRWHGQLNRADAVERHTPRSPGRSGTTGGR
ncbi:MAG: UbiX family flavin prenyltransferase [Solirubrobacteraceae bacterium]